MKIERQKEKCSRDSDVWSSILSENALKFMSSEHRVDLEGQSWLGQSMEYDNGQNQDVLYLDVLGYQTRQII